MCCETPGMRPPMQSWKRPVACTTFGLTTASGGRNPNAIINSDTVYWLRSAEFPYLHPRLAVYVALTDGHGDTSIRLRLVDVNEEHPAILEAETVASFANPLEVVELVFPAMNLVLPQPG